MGKEVMEKETEKSNGLQSGDEPMEEEEEEEDYGDMSVEEFNSINSVLDSLNSALDNIEQKNDNIHAQLLQLLEANREVRKQIQDGTVAERQPDQKS